MRQRTCLHAMFLKLSLQVLCSASNVQGSGIRTACTHQRGTSTEGDQRNDRRKAEGKHIRSGTDVRRTGVQTYRRTGGNRGGETRESVMKKSASSTLVCLFCLQFRRSGYLLE